MYVELVGLRKESKNFLNHARMIYTYITTESNDDSFQVGRFHELPKCNSRGGKFNGSSTPTLLSMVLLISR